MEIKFYLIVLDLDGMLLKDDKIILEYIFWMIQCLKDDGYYVCILMGCLYCLSFMYYQQMELIMLIVNFNGVFVYYLQDDSWG